ncbi:hypothetical protein Ahy_B01g054955 [Arachis hypogaea]|uniref:CoA carboxyltransferase N-terminal domain-containing protein n=1 Tax=Arachis hypogaea TaxID=3818 RepID=A0A445AUJ8_ARAHY|nr:hypothetical protein Ahy_B01g054955 [Arachis hypogaea]
MLGDIIIAEPDAYIAFAGKRVIEQTLNTTIPEGSQVAEYLFQKGLFDSIVPRNPLKGVLSEKASYLEVYRNNTTSSFNSSLDSSPITASSIKNKYHRGSDSS